MTAVVLLAGAWFAAPADAAGLLTGGQAPTVDAPALTGQVSAATTADVAATGAAAETTANHASRSVQRVVSGAADAAGGAGAQPAVDAAIPDVVVTASPPAESAVGAGPRRVQSARAAGKRPERPTGSAPGRAEARRRSAAPSPEPLSGAPVAGPVTQITVAGASHDAVVVHAAPDRPPSLDPISSAVGDSSVSGGSASLFFGGLAVLLTALCVAGPAFLRNLPGRRAMCWPAAFVPLLERPG